MFCFNVCTFVKNIYSQNISVSQHASCILCKTKLKQKMVDARKQKPAAVNVYILILRHKKGSSHIQNAD